ncbi:Metallo-dependent hydrolase [Violaceomyces palustris]|uniref:Metallo-dependent hydrolase n=1 Tax=Violaceomyces palustris TaxID=1673888 RepID=A0ACD0NXT9_9BASI|nr:Metallo-dependent hydrolase [Violaceomyces palustris]
MPSKTTTQATTWSHQSSQPPHQTRLIKFQNCSALQPDGSLVDNFCLFVDPSTGKIVDGQHAFYAQSIGFTQVVDLGGHLLSPGFIDVQINGAYGIDFSSFDESDETYHLAAKNYLAKLDEFSKKILATGVTSFVPTIITQKASSYRKILPLLSPRSRKGQAHSLGYHAEGPFLSPDKRGAHCVKLIREAPRGIEDIEEVYGKGESGLDMQGAVKILTLAPDVRGVMEAIPELAKRGVIISLGHTNSDLTTALRAKEKGASFITHLFNAMESFRHRDPGVIGLLGDSDEIDFEDESGMTEDSPWNGGGTKSNEGGKLSKKPRPYYGLITDGQHSHPCSVRMAYSCHPEGCVLTSDAMPWMDPEKPDGIYDWRENQRVVKKGYQVTLEGTTTLAGSVVPMDACVRGLSRFASIPLHTAAKCASTHPSRMLGLDKIKGVLQPGADADLVVLDKKTGAVLSTWILGEKAWQRGGDA